MAIDFISPLPKDKGFNCIVTMTDHSGAAIEVLPSRMDVLAKDFAQLFFNNWYCENGLPCKLILDRDKLFVSRFWKRLAKISGVKLGMSTVFHPETDGVLRSDSKGIRT